MSQDRKIVRALGSRVALIGRPNVGKSTLFNILSRTRKAVVKNQPGVTRDIQIERAEWWGKSFDVIDTGGLTEAQDEFSKMIRTQVLGLLQGFDLLVMIFDGKVGLVPEDQDVVKAVIESGKPFLAVVNKVDRMHEADLVQSEFAQFGLDTLPASFERREGIDKIVEWILERLPEEETYRHEGIRIAIVGKPNVGKSSLTNFLLGSQRMHVSDTAGTTVDAVESPIQLDGKNYLIVDTAGLRKSAKRVGGVESIAAYKSHEAIDKSDIVILVVDGLEGPRDQDATLMQYIWERGKPFIVAANKTDLGEKQIPGFRHWFRDRVAMEFHFNPDVPVEFISAHTGAGVKSLFARVDDLWEKVHTRITTSQLNNFFYDVIRKAPAPVYGSQNVKFYYLTQTRQLPPSFIAFANHPKGVNDTYKRFLTKRIQEQWGLQGVPIRIHVTASGES